MRQQQTYQVKHDPWSYLVAGILSSLLFGVLGAVFFVEVTVETIGAVVIIGSLAALGLWWIAQDLVRELRK